MKSPDIISSKTVAYNNVIIEICVRGAAASLGKGPGFIFAEARDMADLLYEKRFIPGPDGKFKSKKEDKP